ncbi:N-terminal nucleophile aminohydrolase [Durotheca rogersii]|uniref:N-terminal nucleophile aminohydrolase n=1 Tax=Durotheca rogersii TaxID=419775 RepID=UPI0022200DAF|nr:N-terminal nucleophile aminohydrolase [Durotheca rogersii]KAI5866078.1 N-terminal nucleophile aminohydrolase [Durotheca rogersii]
MEYKRQPPSTDAAWQQRPQIRPRLIIHGGAGNITPKGLGPDGYKAYRQSLLTIVSKADVYMRQPVPSPRGGAPQYPSALEVATYAVTLLEDDPLYNSGRGAVFTRDGVNELDASVMVSRGRAKRGVGVTGLRHVRNPVLLARAMLEHGDGDLARGAEAEGAGGPHLDVPSAQGHTILYGATAEVLARRYGLALVDPSYFFTQRRWDEHVRALERERGGDGVATWSADEYLPQGTCGAVALDADGVVCAATSTGGLTNKLTGRIGDTPVVGAGFWAEEWAEEAAAAESAWQAGGGRSLSQGLPGPVVELSAGLRRLLADCLPAPFAYSPLSLAPLTPVGPDARATATTTTRSLALSGTGNGDSFLRVAAARTAAAIARWGGASGSDAVRRVAGAGGELQRSAGDRWGLTGEGQGGIIGVESVVTRDASGRVVASRARVLDEYNCAGMFRAWVDDDGKAVVRVFRPGENGEETFEGEGRPEDVWRWSGEKA